MYSNEHRRWWVKSYCRSRATVSSRHRLLGRHERKALLVQRRVHGDSHMALALVQKPLQLASHPHAAHGDALGAPLPPPFGCHDVAYAHHGVEVVHRLALSHEYDVGQSVHLRQGIYLVQDVGSRQIALPALLSSLTKQAVHLAAHLARHTQRGTVVVGNEHRLDTSRPVGNPVLTAYGEEVLHRAVLRTLAVDGRQGSHLVVLRQPLSVLLRQIGHQSDVAHMLHIQPLCYLLGSEGRHPQGRHGVFQFSRRHAHESLFLLNHSAKVVRK